MVRYPDNVVATETSQHKPAIPSMSFVENFIGGLYGLLIWDQTWNARSKEKFEELFSEVRVKTLVEDYVGIPPVFFVFLVPVCGYLLGLFLSFLGGIERQFLRSRFVLVFFIDLTLAVGTIMLLEDKLAKAVIDMQECFDIEKEVYYEFMWDFIERTTEPLPHVSYEKGRLLHRPSLLLSFFGGTFLVILPVVFYPEQISGVIGFELVGLYKPLQVYLLSLLFVAVIIGTLVSWVIITSTVYLGFRIQKHKVRLDITKTPNNLGFTSYSNMVLISLSAYLIGYLITTVFLFSTPTTWSILVVVIMSILPIAGFVVSQYGIHRSIVKSKEERLRQLRSEFDEDLDIWFSFKEPNPKVSSNQTDISEFIEAKRAIEEIPNWPINMRSVFKLVSATFASNAWVLVQVIGVIN